MLTLRDRRHVPAAAHREQPSSVHDTQADAQGVTSSVPFAERNMSQPLTWFDAETNRTEEGYRGRKGHKRRFAKVKAWRKSRRQPRKSSQVAGKDVQRRYRQNAPLNEGKQSCRASASPTGAAR
jgi:hypothetical protein